MRKPRRGISEHEIQVLIMDYLKAKRIFHWRSNVGAFKSSYGGKSRFMRFGAVGSPDIMIVHKGKFIGLEVKRPNGGFQSQHQVQFEHELLRAGGHYAVVRSLEDAIKALGEESHG